MMPWWKRWLLFILVGPLRKLKVKKSKKRVWIEVGVIVAIALLIRQFVVAAYNVPTGSMKPTIQPGDFVFVNRLAYKFRKPRRGELLVFRYPPDPKFSYVKRVIGLPGEIVEIRNKIVYINGVPLQEPYVVYELPNYFYEKGRVRDNYGPIKVPEDCYFVMGDNRDNSYDSRFWGFVEKKNILGRAYAVYLQIPSKNPFNRVGFFRYDGYDALKQSYPWSQEESDFEKFLERCLNFIFPLRESSWE